MQFEKFISKCQMSFHNHICVINGAAIELAEVDLKVLNFLRRGVVTGREMSRQSYLSQAVINRTLKNLRTSIRANKNEEIISKLEKSEIYPKLF